MPDACFVYIRLISDAIVRKPNKYKVKEHWWPKIQKVVPNMAKAIYAWDKKIISISNKIILLQTENLYKWPFNWFLCQHRSADYWATNNLGDEMFTSSGITQFATGISVLNFPLRLLFFYVTSFVSK